ncbi:MAG: ATP-dependent helicase [Aeriscardovia sp.]|nr:ATP-dependent helicase [Aeriscardovia sp.]
MADIEYTDEQKAIITDTAAHTDMLIIAGAGSGKTFTMTHRISRLIRQDNVAPQKILGLTFTKKAANELGDRVTSIVCGEESSNHPGDNIDNAYQKLKNLLGRPHVGTYDSFFQEIVRQYGLLIGISPETTILTNAGQQQLITQVLSNQLEQSDATNLREQFYQKSEDDIDGEEGLDMPSFEELVNDVKNLESHCLQYMIDETHLTFSSAINRVQEWNDKWTTILKDLCLQAKNLYQQADNTETTAINDLQKQITKLQKEIDTLTWPSLSSKNLKKDSCEKYYNNCEMCVHLQLYKTVYDQYKLARQRSIIIELTKKYNEMKYANHLATFADITAYAFQLIATFPSIAEEYRHRFHYVFLDEYQDTSSTQALLIAKIFHETSETSIETSINQEKSYVTAVGDPFQSIYGFRGASPDSFNLFEKNFTPQKFYLSQSRRNKKTILEHANTLISNIEKLNENNNSVQELRPISEGGEISVKISSSKDEEIKNIVDFAKKEKKKYSDSNKPIIAVLTRTNKDAKTYTQDIQKYIENNNEDLTCSSETSRSALEYPEILDLLDLLTICADMDDASESILRLLASPRYHIDADDFKKLAQYAKNKNEQIKDSLSNTTDQDTLPVFFTLNDLLHNDELIKNDLKSDTYKILHQLSQSIQLIEKNLSFGMDIAIRTAITALDLDTDRTIAFALQNKDNHLSIADTVASAVESYKDELSNGQVATLRGFLLWIKSDSEDLDKKWDKALNTVATDIVVTTMHSSKGLEWPAVIIAGFNKIPSSQSVNFKKDTSNPYTNDIWITQLDDVPAPLRTDAASLPSFPHQLAGVEDPLKALDIMEDSFQELDIIDRLLQLYKEIYDITNMPSNTEKTIIERLNTYHDKVQNDPYKGEITKLESKLSADHDCLTELYGKRAYADELHLLYVALTRSSGDVLLTATKKNDAKENKESNASERIKRILDLLGLQEDDSDDINPEQSDEKEQSVTEPTSNNGVWPTRISEHTQTILNDSVSSVNEAIKKINDGQQEQVSGPLTELYTYLSQFMQSSLMNDSLETRAAQALSDQTIGTTRLQNIITGSDDVYQKVLFEIIRPLPHGPVYAAEKGTAFHAWVANELDPENISNSNIGDYPQTEEWNTWTSNFAHSEWAQRHVFSVEQEYSIDLKGHPIPAKMDAVFYGSLQDPNETTSLTIVDWKTGHEPKTQKEINERLLQLDIYRLALSRNTQYSLKNIDACLYYVRSGTQIQASHDFDDKTLQEWINDRFQTAPRLYSLLSGRSDN